MDVTGVLCKGYGNTDGVARYIPQFESFGWFLCPRFYMVILQ